MSRLGYGEFELDLSEAIRRDLPPFVRQVPLAPLTAEAIEMLPETQGVYALYLDGELVYVGKTSSEEGFKQRVGRHRKHVQHRLDLDPSKIQFKAVRIMVFNMFDVEKILIEEAGGVAGNGKRAPWNYSGFGGNDPGVERDTQKVARFDKRHPILVDLELDFLTPGSYPLNMLLTTSRKSLPYTFRFEKELYQDERAVTIEGNSPPTARQILGAAIEALPHGWQATVLPGRVILYEEARIYRHSQLEIRKSA